MTKTTALYLKQFSIDLKRALKVEAAFRGITLQQLAQILLEEGLQRKKAKKEVA